MYSDDDLLPLSGLQYLAYCKRQWALIHLEQLWEDSADTIRGDYFHERVDAVGYTCTDGVYAERRVRLVSYELGIYGVADIVEFSGKGSSLSATPVEYKVGRPKHKEGDRLQVAAQALCLEEMYKVAVNKGYLFYGETRRRESVVLEKSLRDRVKQAVLQMHELFERRETPKPVLSTRCKRCSLADVCIPQTFSKDAHLYWENMGEGWS